MFRISVVLKGEFVVSASLHSSVYVHVFISKNRFASETSACYAD